MSVVLSSETIIRQSLSSLSGNYGIEPWNQHGYLVSNDGYFAGVSRVFDEICDRPEINREGIALFIGQGAVFSLLPHIRAQYPVVVDINPAVPAFAEVMQRAITENNNSNNATTHVLDVVASVRGTENSFSTADHIREQLNSEKTNLGEFHWSLPANFERVQRALSETPLIPIVADISNDVFLDGLRETSHRAGLDITSANITNIVEYRSFHFNLGSEFLWKLPLAEKALILFSSHKKNLPEVSLPTFRLAEGPRNLKTALGYLASLPWLSSYSEKMNLADLIWRKEDGTNTSE